jgi:hypothetical protein
MTDEGGHTVLNVGDEKVVMADKVGRRPEVLAYVGKEVIMGVRPECMFDDARNLELYKNSVLEAHVDVIEMMGSETYLYLIYQGNNFTARVNARSTTRAGDDIRSPLIRAHPPLRRHDRTRHYRQLNLDHLGHTAFAVWLFLCQNEPKTQPYF